MCKQRTEHIVHIMNDVNFVYSVVAAAYQSEAGIIVL